MADGYVICVPGRRRAWLRLGAGFAAVALFLAVPSCGAGDSEEARTSKLEDKIRSSYDVTFQRYRPRYVMITYPDTVAKLPAIKRKELEVVRDFLKTKGIAVDVKKRADVIEIVEGKTGKQYSAFKLSEGVAKSCEGGTALILNLDVGATIEATLHPDLRGRKIKVMAFSDPLTLAASLTNG